MSLSSPTFARASFIRPLRDRYKHDCGHVTVLSPEIAARFARNPSHTDATKCIACGGPPRPLDQFKWTADGRRVGS